MNDRFKCRVWDIKEENYIEELDIVRLTQYGSFVFNNAENNTEPALNPNRFIFEQCTGLKDNNGNLIYEGDIVCIVEYGDYDFEKAIKRKQKIEKIKNLKVPPYQEPAFINKNHAQIIVWDNKRATFMMKERINSTGRPESLRNKRYVVIGNINENPELLEKNDE